MRRPVQVRVFVGVALAILGAGLGGCKTNPATGRQSLALMSWDWEKGIALQAGPEFTKEYGGETPDAVVQEYVDEVGGRLTDAALEQAYAEVPELDWSYTLLDSEVLNAFALPGGKVYLSRGLAVKLENEAQMAGVIGHEVGHVMARHGNQRITKQVGFNVAMTGLAAAAGMSDEDSAFHQYGQYAVPALALGGNVVLLSYGRDEEMEADELGMQYMAACGWDPAGQRAVMEILGRESQGSARPPEWLSTHPTSETRINRINRLLEEKYSHTQGNSEYALNAEQYKERMLSRLAKLPPPQQRVEDLEQGAAFQLDEPVTWCAHCAHEASLAAR